MFVTVDSTRIPSPVPKGVHVWSAVEIELLVPLVLVSMTQKATEADLPLTSTFITMPEHVPALLTAPGFTLDSVALLSPARINHSEGWMLEPLQELWRCSEPADDAPIAWLFRVPDREYSDSVRNTPVDHLCPDQCLFDYRKLKTRAADQSKSRQS